jgi:hypothetical protein
MLLAHRGSARRSAERPAAQRLTPLRTQTLMIRDNGIVAPTRVRLKPGVAAVDAIRVLREQIQAANQVATGAVADYAMREEYIRWVETAEAQLAWVTHDRSLVDMFHTERFWHIHDLHHQLPRPFPLVMAERDRQVAALTHLAEDLEQRVRRLTAAGGEIAVLDTNVLLHYLPPDQIPWCQALGRGSWRLMVPLRVIEELDAKKYSGSKTLSSRARDLLPRLERLVGEAGEPREVRTGVTLEIPVDPSPRYRPQDADEEILAFCAELPQLTGTNAILVTGDTSMRLRARAQQTGVRGLKDAYRRDREEAS